MIPRDFLDYVITPTLQWLNRADDGIDSPGARFLLLGTALHESDDLRYMRQIGGGPGMSFFQIETPTFKDIDERWLESRLALKRAVRALAIPAFTRVQQLTANQHLACAYARCVYRARPGAIPDPQDVAAMADLWSKRYQTTDNPVKERQFADRYKRHVLPLVKVAA